MTEGTLAKCTAIVDVIKKSGKTPIKADDIAAEAGMGLSGWNVSHMIRTYVVPELAPNIKKAPKLGYFWGDEKEVKTEKKSFNEQLKEIAETDDSIRQYVDSSNNAGCVYALDSFYHGELILLLGWSKSHVSGLKLELVNGMNSGYDPQMHIKLNVIGVEKPEYYVDPAYIWCYPRNRIGKRKLWIDENQFKKEIKPAVARALGLDVPPAPEVRVETVTTSDPKVVKMDESKELRDLQVRLQIAEETGKIWKQALYAVTGYKEG